MVCFVCLFVCWHCIWAGTNGYIWVGAPLIGEDAATAPTADSVTPKLRERIARVRNVIVALAQENIAIYDARLVYAI